MLFQTFKIDFLGLFALGGNDDQSGVSQPAFTLKVTFARHR